MIIISQKLRTSWKWKWSRSVAQSCPTLCDPVDCSPPSSSVHGILQARVLEWVAISFSRGFSWPRDRTQVSHIAGRCFNLIQGWSKRKPLIMADLIYPPNKLFLVTDLGCLIFAGVFLESFFSVSSEDCKGKGISFTNLTKLLQRLEERSKIPQGRRRDTRAPWSSWETLRPSRICYLEMAEGNSPEVVSSSCKGCPSRGTLATTLYF